MAVPRRSLLASWACAGAGVACLAAGCGGQPPLTRALEHPLALGVVNHRSEQGGVVCAAPPLGGSLYPWMDTMAPQGTMAAVSDLRTPPPYAAVDAVVAVDPGMQDQIAPYAVRLGPSLKVNGALLADAPPGAMRLGVALAGSRFTEETIWLPLLFDPLVVFYRPDMLRSADLSVPHPGWTFRDLVTALATLRARRMWHRHPWR